MIGEGPVLELTEQSLRPVCRPVGTIHRLSKHKWEEKRVSGLVTRLGAARRMTPLATQRSGSWMLPLPSPLVAYLGSSALHIKVIVTPRTSSVLFSPRPHAFKPSHDGARADDAVRNHFRLSADFLVKWTR